MGLFSIIVLSISDICGFPCTFNQAIQEIQLLVLQKYAEATHYSLRAAYNDVTFDPHSSKHGNCLT